MNLDARVQSRYFTDLISETGVRLNVLRYGWDALGGPRFAEIEGAGSEIGLWGLLDTLRSPVVISDEEGREVWWGYVHEVKVRIGVIEVGVSLDNLWNRVAVAYSYIAPGSNTVGTRATTAYVQDDTSVGEYGTKELLDSRDGCSVATAEARRDAILDRLKYPIPMISNTRGRTDSGAMLYCRGWWETLDWRHYARDAGLAAHTGGLATQELGSAAGNARVAQSFQISGEGWDAYTVALRVSKVVADGEDVDDNVVVELCGDSGGAPSSVLASAQLDGASLTTSTEWVEFALNAPVTLSVGAVYWLVVRRSGAANGSNYYRVIVDEDLGYDGGVFRIEDGAWVARDPDADMAFKVQGVEETTVQIDVAVDGGAEFVSGVEIVDHSGVRSSQYRDGDTTVRYVVEQLLGDGTSNGRRMLATVTSNRVVLIYEEPGEDNVTLMLTPDGTPEDRLGNALPAHTCPVAQWCELRDVIPATVNMRGLADPGRFFVERAEYDARQHLWIPEARGVPSPWEIGQMVFDV